MRSCSSKAGILLCNTIEQGLNFGLTFAAQHLDFKFPESGQALKGQGQMSPRVQNPPALTNPRYSGTQLLPNQVHMRFNGRWRKQRSEEHTSELQSRPHLVCRLLLEKKKDRELWFAAGQAP